METDPQLQFKPDWNRLIEEAAEQAVDDWQEQRHAEEERRNEGGFVPILILVIIGAAVAMTGCVTLAEHRRAMEQAEDTGFIKGLSDGSKTCYSACWTVLNSCQMQLAEAQAHATFKKPKLINGVPPCGNHDPSYFGSKGCYVDHWPSMSVPNYEANP